VKISQTQKDKARHMYYHGKLLKKASRSTASGSVKARNRRRRLNGL
jgi:hypothetical protein